NQFSEVIRHFLPWIPRQRERNLVRPSLIQSRQLVLPNQRLSNRLRKDSKSVAEFEQSNERDVLAHAEPRPLEPIQQIERSQIVDTRGVSGVIGQEPFGLKNFLQRAVSPFPSRHENVFDRPDEFAVEFQSHFMWKDK